MPAKAPVIALVALGATLLAAPRANAQSADGFDKSADDIIAAQKQAKDEKGDKMPGEKDKPKVEAPPDDPLKYDPREDPSKQYLFVGLRFRDVIVPQFLLNIFASGGRTVNVAMFGPEFSRRKNGVEYDVSMMYADYSMSDTLFKGKNGGDEAFEVISSTMKVLYFTFDLLYDLPVDKSGRFGLLVGGGIGFGGVFGSLYRTQAFPTSGNRLDPNTPSQWGFCTGAAGTPVAKNGMPYCDASNNHYGTRDAPHSENSWASGGSKPIIIPWLSIPQVSFRYKPIKQLQTRLDLGFSMTGFFFGMSASYGL